MFTVNLRVATKKNVIFLEATKKNRTFSAHLRPQNKIKKLSHGSTKLESRGRGAKGISGQARKKILLLNFPLYQF